MEAGVADDGAAHPFRVHVSGLAKETVKRAEGSECLEEEYQVGDFFYNRGCEVAFVALIVDKRNNCSRGFAFVDFDNEDSYEKALTFDGTENPPEVKLDKKSDGKIRIARVKAPAGPKRDGQLQLMKERDRTEGLERDLRLRVARINEVMEEIHRQRDRQLALQQPDTLEDQITLQRQRQAELLTHLGELDGMEASLGRELRAEQGRTRALERLHVDVDIEHADEGHKADGAGPDTGSAQAVAAEAAGADEALPVRTSSQLALPSIVPEAHDLHRTISYSQVVSQASAAPADQIGSQPPAEMPLQRMPSAPRPWVSRRAEKEEVLQRSASASRNILDEKIQALERAMSKKAPGVGTGSETASRSRRWADLLDDEYEASEAPTAASALGHGGAQKDVLVRKLPPLPADELEAALRAEFARLWEVLGRPSPPRIEEVRVVEPTGSSYAERLSGGSMDGQALITFGDPFDAWLVIERCGQSHWSNAATPMLHGRLLQVDWPPAPARPPPPDFRKMTWKADTDASSQVSYATIGTACSRSAQVAQRSADVGRQGGDQVPLLNRTVILSGVPPSMKAYNVVDEVKSLLQRLYRRKSFVFDPETHLHKGLQGGIEVREPRTRLEENGGTVKLRLRNYGDAIWLVEQATGLSIEGRRLRASWAAPRLGGKRGGKGSGKGGGGW